MTSGSYAFVVDWGDGSTSVVTNTNMSTNATHVYGVSGIYTLTITGRILGWLMLSSESKKITEISQWGTLKAGALGFFNCENLLISASDALDLEANLGQMFQGCSSLGSLDVRGWDVSSGTNFIDFAFGVTIPTAIYDQTLVNWEALNLQPGASQEIDFGNSKYTAGSAAETARANIIANDGWAISDGGSTP
jgi:surface protein